MKNGGKSLKQGLVTFTHSIRFRLVLWFVLILGIVMGVFSGFVYWRQAQDIRSLAIGRLNFALEQLVGPPNEGEHELEHLMPTSPEISSNNLYNANLHESDVVAYQSIDGTVLQSSGVLSVEQIRQLNLPVAGWNGIQQINLPVTVQKENERYLFIKPAMLQNGQVAGYLLLGVPLDPNNQLRRLIFSLVIGNLITLAIALSGGFWLAERAMRPVHTISKTAQQISETDLHKRLHLPGKDELAELGNTFDAMLNRLQGAFERQRQFTADASHELRTPLTIINLETGRGLSARRTPDEYERILGTIQTENQLMIRLVNNLLALSRMDAGQMKLKSEPLDLRDLVGEVIERMEPVATTQGVSLISGDLEKTQITGDRSTLIQMLTNLIENAIKYSKTVVNPEVHVSTGTFDEAGRKFAWVQVQDNGVGIAAEHLGQIFDRFYKVDASRSRDERADEYKNLPESSGTGLGLAIAQWIARAHHGEIKVESAVGKGSTFEVILPASIATE